MRHGIAFGLLAGLVVMQASHGLAKPEPSSRTPRVDAVTFSIRHRVFHDFRDVQRVRLNQDFLLGDTEYRGRVVQYVPDFEMDLKSRRVFSRSDQPNNPAFRVIVRKGKVPQDTSWAFLNMPPHFGRRSYFAFHVVRIDFLGHAPMLADTTAAPEAPATQKPGADSTSQAAPGRRDTLSRR